MSDIVGCGPGTQRGGGGEGGRERESREREREREKKGRSVIQIHIGLKERHEAGKQSKR